MTINNPKLKHHVERVCELTSGLPMELGPICGLMDAYQFYARIDGPDSVQAGEALELLLSDELRPALRQWYRTCGENMNPAALEFRAFV